MEQNTEWLCGHPPPGWICTDPDNMQFARQINETTWEYRQLKDDVELTCHHYLYDIERFKDVWWCEKFMWDIAIINANDYTEQEQWEHVKHFYTSEEFLEFRLQRDWQMVCECIFENNLELA